MSEPLIAAPATARQAMTSRSWEEYDAFRARDLSEHRIAYLYVDGIAERLRAGRPREAVLAASGIGEDGRKVLLHLMAGSKEDTQTVRAFFPDMRARGLGDPVLVVSDGAHTPRCLHAPNRRTTNAMPCTEPTQFKLRVFGGLANIAAIFSLMQGPIVSSSHPNWPFGFISRKT